MIPDHIKDKILSKVSLVELMEREGVRFTRSGRQHKALCPFHKEKTPSFSVNNEQGVYYCFGCHAKGNAIGFLREYKNLSFVEAMEYLASLAQEDIKPYLTSGGKDEERREEYVKMYQTALEFYQTQIWSKQGAEALKYFLSRRLTEETVKAFRLGYSPGPEHLAEFLSGQGFDYGTMVQWGLIANYEHRDRFANRVIFPIYTREGLPIAFGGRILFSNSEKEVKYINSPDTPWFRKSDVLYGLFQAKDTLVKERRAIIVEGYMDVIGLHQAGVTSAVAPLGTALTESQLQLLQRYVDTIVLLFDADRAGLSAASRSVDMIVETKMECRVVILPDGLDPDEMIMKEGRERFLEYMSKSSLSALDFKWQYIRKNLMPDDSQQKQVEEIFRYIARIPHSLTQNNAVRHVAGDMSVDPEILYKDFKNFSRQVKTPKHQTGGQVGMAALQRGVVTDEHERRLLAMLIVQKDKHSFEDIEIVIQGDMFTNSTYKKWFDTLIQEKPIVASMYEVISEDDKLSRLVMEIENTSSSGDDLLEQVYIFRMYYFKRKSHECTIELQQAQKNNLESATVNYWYEEKMKWEKNLHDADEILHELREKSVR